MSRALKALAWLAPEAALRRARALAALDVQSRYAGATVGRRGASFRDAQQAANVAIAGKLSLLRARSHEMVRDHWAFARILDVTVGHAIGPGITVVPDNGNDRADRQARQEWDDWCAVADITGETDFHGLTGLNLRAALESGSGIVRMIPQKRGGPRRVPLALKVLEGEHIDHGRDGVIDGRTVRLGTALGDNDERLGMYLFRDHPGEGGSRSLTAGRWASVFFDRSEYCHLFKQQRPGQVLGVPVFAPVLLPARDLADLMEAVVVKAKIEACFSGFIVNPEDAGPLDGHTHGGTSGPAITDFRPGMIAELRPGQDVRFGQPSTTSAIEPINYTILLAMAAGAGITYDQLTGDLRKANYSSLRAGKIEFRRFIEQLQWLTIVPQQHRRIVERWTEYAVMAGVLRRRKEGWRWKYVMPANEPIDPKKDLEADIMAVRAGRMSPQEFIAGWGRDWREVMDDFSGFLSEIDAKGLVFDIDPRRTNQSGTSQSEPKYASDSEEE